MNYPLLYEINTRCWLRELSEKEGRTVSLANIPNSEVEYWHRLGFTHIWLMGVWTTGPRSRAHSLEHPELRNLYDAVLPGWNEDDVSGSPYAIADYIVPPRLGGEAGLQRFREQLHSRGLKLVLDFVPNHVGLDHEWVIQQPELFVPSSAAAPGTYLQATARGPRWFTHGKDPHFPPWVDTVQLDYRNPATRAAVVEQLLFVARRCDGVRCDMAMLVLNDVFEKNWRHLPFSGPTVETEFWAEAIQTVRSSIPSFLFLAEVYWDLEARLQALGFDYTYNKRVYDYLVGRQTVEVRQHLLKATPKFLQASAHFLENHDELRIASLLSLAEHRAAALLILGLPGMRLLNEGQLTGATLHVGVYLGRRLPETPQPEITAMYEHLLTVLQMTAVGKGQGKLLIPSAVSPDNITHQNLLVFQWQSTPALFDLVVVNLAPHASQGHMMLQIAGLAERDWQVMNLLGEERVDCRGEDLLRHGLLLDVPAHGAHLFAFRSFGRTSSTSP